MTDDDTYTWRAEDDMPDDQGRTWLAVPYADKDAAKRLGAGWDGERRQWYAPRRASAQLARWSVLPEELDDEDREFGPGLFVDLIPSTSWFTNVRSVVSETDWYRIRTMVYGRAGNRCETCGRAADHERGLYLEAHERFAYAGNVQELRRLICLCSACHAVTHMGLTELRGEGEAAMGHLMAVTGMSRRQARHHVQDAFALWEQRSRIQWIVDVRMIEVENVVFTGAPAGYFDYDAPAGPPASVRLTARY